jgi:DNA-binding beta-propeller fold protein YncE
MRIAQSAKALVLGSLTLLLVLVGSTGCQSTSRVTQEQRKYAFWPPAPDEPHIQFLTSYNSSADVTPPTSKMDEMLYGAPKVLVLSKPYGVAMWQGKIYVCDVRSKGITVLDLRQHLTKAVGASGAIEIAKPVDIAIAPDGFKYVVDGGKHAIVVLDPQDHIVTQFAPKDFNPVSAAVYGNELFVSDFTGQTVKVLDRKTGGFLRKIGEAGAGDGQFVRPLAVRIDPSGVLFVDDVLTCRVQRFDRDGAFLSAFAQAGNRPGDLVRPKHFSFDSNGYLYIADAAFANVQVFDEKQKVVGYFGSPGTHSGAMSLPAGVFIDENPEDLALFQQYVHPAFQAERLILVSNQFGNQRVSVYAGGTLKPGKTVADLEGSRSDVEAGTLTPTTRPTTQPDLRPYMRRHSRPSHGCRPETRNRAGSGLGQLTG